eukprot:scaffold792_cov60-Phaeocystis_antarctica.AAC.5
MSRTELWARAAVAVYLMHLNAGEGLLVVPDLVALHHRRLGRDEKGSCDEGEEPEPVGHDYPLARQVGAVNRRGMDERFQRQAARGVRVVFAVVTGHQSLDTIDGEEKDARDAEGDHVVSVIPHDRANASRTELVLEVGGHE